jgi:hypothetical protein
LIPSFGQTQNCDTIKRIAAKWVIERNECRELLQLSDAIIAGMVKQDSLSRLEVESLRKAINGFNVVVSHQDEKIEKQEKKIGRLKKQRNIFLITSSLLAGVVALFVI